MLANSVGIIDQGYRGNLYIALTKIDDSVKDLELPYKCCQMILKKQVYSIIEESKNDFSITDRNNGGFGSTNKL
jgi:dUTPase